MNTKKIFLAFLFFSNLTTKIMPTMGFEIAFPLSALIMIIPAGDLAGLKAIMIRDGGYGKLGGMTARNALPQTYGYYATTQPFDFCLQAGVNIQYGFLEKNGPYSNSVFYFSDIMRAQLKANGSRYSASPQSAYDRGQPYNSPHKGSVADVLLYLLGPGNTTIPVMEKTGSFKMVDTDPPPTASIQIMKYYGFFNAQGTTIKESSFAAVNGETVDYYFAQTGVDVFIPLHMLTPGTDLQKPDPDYLNYGIFPGNYNTPKPGSILPWSDKAMPNFIPTKLAGSPVF